MFKWIPSTLCALMLMIAADTASAAAMETDLGFRMEVDNSRWEINNSGRKSGLWAFANFTDTAGTTSMYVFASKARRPGEGFDGWTERQLDKILRRFGGDGVVCSSNPVSRSPVPVVGIEVDLMHSRVNCGGYEARVAYTSFANSDGSVWVFIWFGPKDRNPAIEPEHVPNLLAGAAWH